MKGYVPQKSSPVKKWSTAIFIIGSIAVLVTVVISQTPPAISLVLIWALVVIYRLQRWRSSSHEASSQREGKIWHERPDLLWLIGSILIVLMGLLQLGMQGLKLNHPIIGSIFDTVDIASVAIALPATFFLGRAYLLERKQQKGIDRGVPLHQTTRSGPQPKEAREEE
jgi:hypothetical protein